MIEATMKRSANRSLAANTGEQVMQMRCGTIDDGQRHENPCEPMLLAAIHPCR